MAQRVLKAKSVQRTCESCCIFSCFTIFISIGVILQYGVFGTARVGDIVYLNFGKGIFTTARFSSEFVPGWEDSTMGNIFASHVIKSNVQANTVLGGINYMTKLATWYEAQDTPLAFFQIGGGIAGDFPICVVPMLNQDLQREAPLWAWFCQISESSTSYGGYSGAPPNEKITWGKLSPDTPKFVIESDATIVAPLIFAYVLDY